MLFLFLVGKTFSLNYLKSERFADYGGECTCIYSSWVQIKVMMYSRDTVVPTSGFYEVYFLSSPSIVLRASRRCLLPNLRPWHLRGFINLLYLLHNFWFKDALRKLWIKSRVSMLTSRFFKTFLFRLTSSSVGARLERVLRFPILRNTKGLIEINMLL